MSDLEQKAREASETWREEPSYFGCLRLDAFELGYLAAAKEAEQEIAALRAQAAQPVKKLTETREIISLLLWKCDNGQGDISVERYRNAFKTAIAELDSVEGVQK